jgi:hypothetical protein
MYTVIRKEEMIMVFGSGCLSVGQAELKRYFYFFILKHNSEFYRRDSFSLIQCAMAFYAHIESTCITESFHQDGRFGPIKLA